MNALGPLWLPGRAQGKPGPGDGIAGLPTALADAGIDRPPPPRRHSLELFALSSPPVETPGEKFPIFYFGCRDERRPGRVQSHRNTPLPQAYTYASSRIATKITISTSSIPPIGESALGAKIVAQGYMKTISTSNTRKIMATM